MGWDSFAATWWRPGLHVRIATRRARGGNGEQQELAAPAELLSVADTDTRENEDEEGIACLPPPPVSENLVTSARGE